MEKLDFLNLTKNELENLINDIVSFLKQLHSISIENFSFLEDEKGDNNGYRNYLKNGIESKLKNKINIKKIEKIKKYIDDLFDLNFKEKVLCHGDIQSKNIIFNYKTNKISGFIDFSDFRLSGRELDFCHFLNFPEDIFRKIITKYLGFYDDNFVNIVKFLHKRELIYEIMNDDILNNKWEYLKKKIYNF